MQTRNSNKVSNSLQHLIMLKSGNFHFPFPCPHTPKDQFVTKKTLTMFSQLFLGDGVSYRAHSASLFGTLMNISAIAPPSRGLPYITVLATLHKSKKKKESSSVVFRRRGKK